MLGPTKRNPNLIVFWKGFDHLNPKKMLHLFVFFFFYYICTVKVYSLKKALLVCYSQLAVWTVSSPLHLFIRLKGFSLQHCIKSRRNFLLHLPP